LPTPLKCSGSSFYLRTRTSNWVVFLTMQAIYFNEIAKVILKAKVRFS